MFCREYEASVQGSQPSTTTTSPQRSRTNSRRRTGEVQIGTGAALTQTPPAKQTDEESSVARRTVYRTVGIPVYVLLFLVEYIELLQASRGQPEQCDNWTRGDRLGINSRILF